MGALRFAHAVGAAAASRTRTLGALESGLERALAAVILLIGAVGVLWPAALAYPLAALGAWLALTLLVRAHKNSKKLRAALQAGRGAQAVPKGCGASEPRAEDRE